ncbi:DUF3999 domain-containing protein [Niveibacterium sp.]|uniref:DUF3999 domain-containing protein n=1 Tax=Niveibacterium sp. TaxID=2017444 RepID=UPI0035B248B5
MSRIATLLVALLCCSVGHAAEEQVADFATRASIRVAQAAPYARLTLPIDAYLAARSPDLRDLRVFNANGEAVPFALIATPPQTRASEQQRTLRWFPLHGEANTTGGDLQVDVRRDTAGTVVSVREQAGKAAGKPLRGYLIDTGSKDATLAALDITLGEGASGFHRVSVEGSDDLAQWQSLQADAVLAVLDFNGEQIRRERIELGQTNARYLRVLWREPVGAAPITAAKFITREAHTEPPAMVWTPASAAQRDAKGDYVLKLPTPIRAEQLRVTLPPGNLLAPVEVATRNDERAPWQRLTSGVVYRLNGEGPDRTSPDIALGNIAIQHLRLHADPRSGGLGNTAPTLQVGLTPQQLVFLTRGPAPYTLALGNPKAAPAALAIGTLVPGYGQPGAPRIADAEAAFGPQASAADSSSPSTPDSPAATRKWVLWLVLVVGVAVMGGMAWSLVKQTK